MIFFIIVDLIVINRVLLKKILMGQSRSKWQENRVLFQLIGPDAGQPVRR